MSSEKILQEMIESIDSKFDTSKGSFVYDILNAGAIKFANYDKSIDESLEKRFVTTSSGKYLEYNAKDHGVTKKTSKQSTGVVTVEGKVGATVKKGDNVATDNVNFEFTQNRVIGNDGYVDVPVKCITYGSIGNVPAGAIKYFPKTIDGLYAVTNKEAIDNGYDDEDETSLKERFFKKVQTPATSGNPAQYEEWAESLDSVGKAKCIRCWNGNGTVKVIIVDANMQPASQEICNEVKEYIESVRPACSGDLTVVSATDIDIILKAKLVLTSDGISKSDVIKSIKDNITTYLKKTALGSNHVSYSKIGGIIQATEGIEEYTNLLINNDISNVNIGEEEVATLGVVEFE